MPALDSRLLTDAVSILADIGMADGRAEIPEDLLQEAQQIITQARAEHRTPAERGTGDSLCS